MRISRLIFHTATTAKKSSVWNLLCLLDHIWLVRVYPDTCTCARLPWTQPVHSCGVMGNRRTDLIKPKCPAESLSPSPAPPVIAPNCVFCQEIGIQVLDPTKLDRAARLTRERPRRLFPNRWAEVLAYDLWLRQKMFLLCPHVHLKGNDRLNWIRENASCSFFGNFGKSCLKCGSQFQHGNPETYGPASVAA